MIALRTTPGVPLPQMDANDFFERWLTHGAGGTCWTTSNALGELLLALGFNAHRVAGSMRDTGYLGHGSVKVRIDDRDWLVDSSMLTDFPLPLTNGIFVADEGIFGAEVEPVDGMHMIWSDIPPHPTLTPCRLMIDDASRELYADRYEASRQRSPFNERLYVRTNRPDARLLLIGRTRFEKTAAGLESCDLGAAEVCASLRDEFGMSNDHVSHWVGSGALDDSIAPADPAPPALPLTQPPSRRTHVNF